MAGPDFQFNRGAIHLPQCQLWIDAHHAVGPGEIAVVSHAHSDHTARHAEVLFTEATRRLMRARVSGERLEHVLPYLERTDLRDSRFGAPRQAHLTLLPAGHVLGSAMTLVETDAGSLLHTGDFKLRPALSCEPCQPVHADILVMETTFGRPGFAFPPTQEVIADLIRFCRETLDQQQVPILLGYSLGKAQEILASLRHAQLPILVTEPIARLNRIYAELGQTLPAHDKCQPESPRGHVVIAPPSGNMDALRLQFAPCRVAVITGWAIQSGFRFRYRADAAFPISDHADFPDLMELVRRVRPRRVYTIHGYASDFAASLRKQGIEAWALGRHEQLEFRL
jgi:Cft2 family RNA processing exonuclease